MICRALFFLAALTLVPSAVRAQCPGNAIYRISNVCEWTAETHPTDFPPNDGFSPMCGVAHNANYQIFSAGAIATNGLRDVAELGDCTLLEGEIDACAAINNCSSDGFFSIPCRNSEGGPGTGVCDHSGMFEVTPTYPYVSAVSMLVPSPDWFVGVNSVNLCGQDMDTGEFAWVDIYPPEGQQNLYAYDAGSDGGVTFLSPDLPLDPFIPITRFDAMNASNIFYNQEAGRLYPLCRVLIERM